MNNLIGMLKSLAHRTTSGAQALRQTRFGHLLAQIDNRLQESSSGPIKVLIGFADWHAPAVPALMTLAAELSQHHGLHPRILHLRGGHPTWSDPEHERLYNKLATTRLQAYLSKWDYVITSTPLVPGEIVRDTMYITVHHGSAFGRTCVAGTSDPTVDRASNPLTDIVFGLSKQEFAYLERVKPGLFAENNRLYFPVGSIKSDPLLSGKYNRTQFLSNLGLSPNKRTIAISSHHCQSSLLRSTGMELLEALDELATDHNILVTGHSLLFRRNWYEWWNEAVNRDALVLNMQNKLASWENGRLCTDLNELPLLNAADLLIADHSSILPQFCLLDRPILFYDNPAVAFDEDVHTIFRAASKSFVDVNSLAQDCRILLANPDQQRVGREQAVNYFFANKGKACFSAAETILALGRITNKNSLQWTRAIDLSAKALES